MKHPFQIDPMQKTDLPQAVNLWVQQYRRNCGDNGAFPNYWLNPSPELEAYLLGKIDNQQVFTAKSGQNLLGYLAYEEFPFHGEATVFCPIVSHAVHQDYKKEVYLSLYQHLAKEWVSRGIFNHMWTIYDNDQDLREILFDLNYGAYVVDAFGIPFIETEDTSCRIKKADASDLHALYELVEESIDFYRSSPLFLKRDPYSKDDILEIIHTKHVLIAWDNEKAIGFINMNRAEENSAFEMFVTGSGLIDELGVYVKPEYRDKKIGKSLVNSLCDYCRSNHIPYLHVDFETANLFANRFWRRYFDPMLLSMRRTVNKDINE